VCLAQPPKTSRGLTGPSGQTALSAVELQANSQGPGIALDLWMVELNAPLRAKLRPNLVMPLLAGLISETGQSARCRAEALELKRGQSLVLNLKMVDSPAQLRTPKRKARTAMLLLAGLTSETGQNVPCLAVALELKQGQSLASSPRTADFHALLRTLRKTTKTVMLPLAGRTSETGQNVPYPAVAPELKPGQSLASSPRMADFHALLRTLRRRTRTAMPLLAGLSSARGLHAKVCAEALDLKPGPGHVLSHLRVDCHAQLNLQNLRTRNVTQLVSGQLLPLKGFYI